VLLGWSSPRPHGTPYFLLLTGGRAPAPAADRAWILMTPVVLVTVTVALTFEPTRFREPT